MENALYGDMAAPTEIEATPGRDLFAVVHNIVPTDAYLVLGRLVASGIPAVLADANFAQACAMASAPVDGVRILVPECYLQQAGELLEALARGDFALSDDADVDESE